MIVVDNNYESEYLVWLASIATKEEMLIEIEKIIDYENSEEVLKKILDGLLSELETIDSLLQEEVDEYLLENKKQIVTKMTILKESLDKYRAKHQHEQELEMFGSSMTLFATNKYGNIMIENDLRRIESNTDANTYNTFIELIKQLVQGKDNFGFETQKPLTNNQKLKGIYEKKDYQARVIYRYVGDYTVIIGAFLKKTTVGKKEQELLINYKSASQNYVDMLENGTLNLLDAMEISKRFYEEKIMGDINEK